MAQGEWDNHKYVSKKWQNGHWVYDYGDGTYGTKRTWNGPSGEKKVTTGYHTDQAARDQYLRGYSQRQARLKAEKSESRKMAVASTGKKIAQKFDLPNKYDKTTGRKWRRLAKNAQGRIKIVKKKLDRLTADGRAKVLKAYKKIKSSIKNNSLVRDTKHAVRMATGPVRAKVRKAFISSKHTYEKDTRHRQRVYRKAQHAANQVKRAKSAAEHNKNRSERSRATYEAYKKRKKQNG